MKKTRAPKPRAEAPPPTPELPQQTPHEAFRAAMCAWHQMAAMDRAARGDRYHRLVDAMFR